MSNNETQTKLEVTIEKNNGNLQAWERNNINTMELCTRSIIKRQIEDRAAQLQQFVDTLFINAGVNAWNELTLETAQNINIAVVTLVSKPYVKPNMDWIGEAMEYDRAKGKNFGFD